MCGWSEVIRTRIDRSTRVPAESMVEVTERVDQGLLEGAIHS
jgi:hypothetical protein